MIRLIIALLCALGLAFAPVAAGAAPMSGDDMPGCTMGKEMPRKTADHGKMECCTPTCQAPAASALLPSTPTDSDGVISTLKLDWVPAKQLTSVRASGLDPPPRT